MKKLINVYSKNFKDVIINIDYLIYLRQQYKNGVCDYIFTMINGDEIIVEPYHFFKIKDELKEMGVYFKHD